MRKIECRGQWVKNDTWKVGSILQCDDGTCFIMDYEDGDFGTKWEVNPETVGESTGYTDKHNNTIFEGDVLLINLEMYDETYTTVVRFDDGGFMIDMKHEDYDYTTIGNAFNYGNFEKEDVMILGNIYNNPELKEL